MEEDGEIFEIDADDNQQSDFSMSSYDGDNGDSLDIKPPQAQIGAVKEKRGEKRDKQQRERHHRHKGDSSGHRHKSDRHRSRSDHRGSAGERHSREKRRHRDREDRSESGSRRHRERSATGAANAGSRSSSSHAVPDIAGQEFPVQGSRSSKASEKERAKAAKRESREHRRGRDRSSSSNNNTSGHQHMDLDAEDYYLQEDLSAGDGRLPPLLPDPMPTALHHHHHHHQQQSQHHHHHHQQQQSHHHPQQQQQYPGSLHHQGGHHGGGGGGGHHRSRGGHQGMMGGAPLLHLSPRELTERDKRMERMLAADKQKQQSQREVESRRMRKEEEKRVDPMDYQQQGYHHSSSRQSSHHHRSGSNSSNSYQRTSSSSLLGAGGFALSNSSAGLLLAPGEGTAGSVSSPPRHGSTTPASSPPAAPIQHSSSSSHHKSHKRKKHRKGSPPPASEVHVISENEDEADTVTSAAGDAESKEREEQEGEEREDRDATAAAAVAEKDKNEASDPSDSASSDSSSDSDTDSDSTDSDEDENNKKAKPGEREEGEAEAVEMDHNGVDNGRRGSGSSTPGREGRFDDSPRSPAPRTGALSDVSPASGEVARSPSLSPTPLKEQLPAYYPALMGCRSVDEFVCLNRIAEGTYGVVYRAREKCNNTIVALKRLKMEKEKEGFPITSLREINTLLKGQHVNIVTVREIVVGSNMDKIYIVMDYVEHDLKSLMETMSKKKQSFSLGEVKTLMLQLLRAVHHLHDNWILHRDLKTSNLLLSHTGILKVGDFGLAREYGSPLKQYTPIVVTLWYRAPELLLGTKFYSTAIDVWSVGVIFGELLAMEPMFPGKSEIDELNRIFKELGTPNDSIWPGFSQLPVVKRTTFTEFPYNHLRDRFKERLSEQGFQLMNKFLTYDPNQRITCQQALQHQYFHSEPPAPVSPAMFPTWPAKSENPNGISSTGSGGSGAAAEDVNRPPNPPSGGKNFKDLGDDDHGVAGFFLGGGGQQAGAGFQLKF